MSNISETIKKNILIKQNFQCANNPYRPALNLSDYKCYLWIHNNGYFDEATYNIHHIDEYKLSNNNTINNIQALCPNCYAVKVNRFNKQKQHFTTSQLHSGRCYMDLS